MTDRNTLEPISLPAPHPSRASRAMTQSSPTAITRPEMRAVRPPARPFEPPPESVARFDGEDTWRHTLAKSLPSPDTRKNRIMLLRLDGAEAGLMFPLGSEPCTIGRSSSNVLEIKDAGVSRFHARVVFIAGTHVLEDLDSRNGTLVFNQRIEQHPLEDGDLIQFGAHACFQYMRTDAAHEQLLRQLYESSTKDALTGTFNRRHFDERLRGELAFAIRHRSELSLLIVDIDDFKRINDSFGHQAGDAVLRHVASTISKQIRNEDIFARYGGEEFALILRGITVADAVRAAERIRALVAVMATPFEGALIPATISIGVSALAESSERSEAEVIAIADARLYAAKRSGRNRVVGPIPPRP